MKKIFLSKKSFGEKKFVVKKIVGKKEFSIKRKFRLKKNWGVKNFDEKNFR